MLRNVTNEVSKLPSNAKEVEDLRRDFARNPLLVFTFEELKVITENFRPDHLLGGGGFGSVYKGVISKERDGLEPLQVAVKVHDGDNSYQGHREWLVCLLSLLCICCLHYRVVLLGCCKILCLSVLYIFFFV